MPRMIIDGLDGPEVKDVPYSDLPIEMLLDLVEGGDEGAIAWAKSAGKKPEAKSLSFTTQVKYDDSEERDDHGRWTSDGDEGANSPKFDPKEVARLRRAGVTAFSDEGMPKVTLGNHVATVTPGNGVALWTIKERTGKPWGPNQVASGRAGTTAVAKQQALATLLDIAHRANKSWTFSTQVKSPDQPRDEHGRFEGSGTSQPSGGKKPADKRSPEQVAADRQAILDHIDKVTEGIPFMVRPPAGAKPSDIAALEAQGHIVTEVRNVTTRQRGAAANMFGGAGVVRRGVTFIGKPPKALSSATQVKEEQRDEHGRFTSGGGGGVTVLKTGSKKPWASVAIAGHKDVPFIRQTHISEGHAQKWIANQYTVLKMKAYPIVNGQVHVPDEDVTRPKAWSFTTQVKYDDNQPRDDHGRWTSGGGGSSSNGSGQSYNTGTGKAPRKGMGDIPITPKMLEDLKHSTAAPYLTPDGHFTPERQALHDKIINDALSAVKPVDHPKLVMMGGGPASGKTAMVTSGAVKLPDEAVAIDADSMKGKIPEVQQMKDAGDDNWAAKSHEESSYLAARLAAAAFETKRNAVLDGTGDSSIEKLSGKIDAAHAAGHTVEAHYITVSPDTAVQRANERAAKTGRVVPETFIRDTHASISRVAPQAWDKFDHVELFDNNGPKGSSPVKIAEGHGPGTFRVLDQEKYDKFLSYGK